MLMYDISSGGLTRRGGGILQEAKTPMGLNCLNLYKLDASKLNFKILK